VIHTAPNVQQSSTHLPTFFYRTEEDLRSSQSGWCSETCQELDVGCDKTNSSTNNTKSNDFMSEEWIVFLRQSASEVNIIYYFIPILLILLIF